MGPFASVSGSSGTRRTDQMIVHERQHRADPEHEAHGVGDIVAASTQSWFMPNPTSSAGVVKARHLREAR